MDFVQILPLIYTQTAFSHNPKGYIQPQKLFLHLSHFIEKKPFRTPVYRPKTGKPSL